MAVKAIWFFYGYLFVWSVYHGWRLMTPMAEWTDPSEKSMSLLLSWLTTKQRRDYLAKEHFYVLSKSGTVYRIRKAVSPFNVDILTKDGSVKDKICFIPNGAPFIGDIMLAQKIALESNEQGALSVANYFNKWHGAVDTAA